MDLLNDIRGPLDVLQTLAIVGIGLVTWLRKPGEDAGAAVTEMKSQQSRLNQEVHDKVTTLEERIKHMPTSDELSDLEGTVKAINERTLGLAEAISSVRASQARVESFLLTGGRK